MDSFMNDIRKCDLVKFNYTVYGDPVTIGGTVLDRTGECLLIRTYDNRLVQVPVQNVLERELRDEEAVLVEDDLNEGISGVKFIVDLKEEYNNEYEENKSIYSVSKNDSSEAIRASNSLYWHRD